MTSGLLGNRFSVLKASSEPFTRFRILLFVALFGCIILSRMPFLPQLLVGEEGAFAELVVNPVPPSEQTQSGLPEMLIGVVDGRHVYFPFQRNIVPYVILEKLGAFIREAPEVTAESKRATVLVRSLYFFLFLIGIVGLIWKSTRSLCSASAVLFFLTTPLAVGASIQPQIDGSIGVALAGLASLLLVNSVSSRRSALAWVIAGLLVGLARHEFALAFAAAAVIMIVGRSFLNLHDNRNFIQALLGLFLGVFSSFMASSSEYISGFVTMGRVYNLSLSKFGVFYGQLYMTWPVYMIACIGLAMIAMRWRILIERKKDVLFIFVFGLFIILGFLLSGWPGDGLPRYYVPALIIMVYACVELLDIYDAKGFRLQFLIVGAFVSLTFMSAARLTRDHSDERSITSVPGLSLNALRAQMDKSAVLSVSHKQIILEHAVLWLYHPDAEFISRDMGSEGAREFLLQNNPTALNRFTDKSD